MTRFSDNIYTGRNATTSALSSRSQTLFSKTVRIAGATGTQTLTLPSGAENIDAKLYVLTAGSAATSDDIVVSAGGTTLITVDAIGSAVGVLRATTAGLGVLTTSSAAANSLSAADEQSVSVTTTKSDQATTYQLQIQFSRADGS